MRRVGIRDVAREAGVSATTVSLVLNGRPNTIAESTRQRVRDAAERIGYAPNTLARALRTKQTRTIGFLSDEIATTPYAVGIVEGAQNAARERGYLLFLLSTGGDVVAESEAVEALARHQVDGVIYASMYHRVVTPPPGLPSGTVFLDARPAEGGFDAVVPDDYSGGLSAVRELVRQGHRRIAFIDDLELPEASTLRLAGYRDALAEAGIDDDATLHVEATTTAAGGEEATGRLLDLPPDVRPTGIFCFNDRMAMGAYRAANHRGIRVPDDLSVVGYDDQQFIAADLDPALTTVALPHYEMGRWAVETLLDRLAAPDAEPSLVRMECPLVSRDSVAPPREPARPSGS